VADRAEGPLRSLGDRYVVHQSIGQGASATVFEGFDQRHDRHVAIKVLRPEVATAASRKRFLREIKIVASLQHPNILPLFDSGQVDGALYFVMPLVEGDTLRARVDRDGPVSTEVAARIIREIADATDYANERGIVHRDLKPENVFLSGDHALVADFGIAKLVSHSEMEGLTRTGAFVGTPAYLSPEQVTGESIDRRADVYSLGCLTYYLLVGAPPFTGPTARAVAAQHALTPAPDIRVIRPGLPDDAAAALKKALNKAPADRFHTTGDFAEAFAHGLEDLGRSVEGRAAVMPQDELTGWRHIRRRALQGLNALGVLALVAWALWFVVQSSPTALDEDRIVVYPLADGLGGTTDGVLASSMILSTLDHAEFLRPVDGWSRLTMEQREDISALSAEEARLIATDRGAAFYLTGRVAPLADSVTVTLYLHDVRSDATVAMASAGGAAGSTGTVQAGLHAMIRLLPEWLDPGRSFDLTALVERDPGAVATWMRGERAYRYARFEEAGEHYRQAVASDPALALAAVKGAAAAHWMDRLEEAEELIELANAADSLLPVRYRHLARGFQHYLDGEADWAVAEFEQALETSPDWSEAWMALGEVYYHLFPAKLDVFGAPEASFRAARENDPGFSPPLYHLAEITLRRGDLAAADTFMGEFARFDPDVTSMRTLGLMRSCVERGPGSTDWGAVIAVDATPAWDAAKSLSAAGAQPLCAAEGFRALYDAPQVTARWGAVMGLQGLLIATDKPQDAAAFLDAAIADGERSAAVLYVINALAGAPFQNRAADVDELVRSIYGDRYEGALLATQWLLGVWHASLGRPEVAQLIHDQMHRPPDDRDHRRSVVLAKSVEAQITLAHGDTAAALATLAQLRPSGPYKDLIWDYAAPLSFAQLTHARLLISQQRFDDAIAVAAVFDHQQPIIYLPFLRESLEIRRNAAEQLGEVDLARGFVERLERLSLAGATGAGV
jgi:serine/threonine-protein kinase